MNLKPKDIFDKKSLIAVGVTLVALGASLLLFNSGFVAIDVGDKLAKATEAVTNQYDLRVAKANFEDVLSVDPKNETALYNLARIYYITGEYDKSLAAIATYKETYPKQKRIHYIAGLANAYAGDLDQAEAELSLFLDSGLATWPGYLDLGWVYFQKGELESAKDVLTRGIDMFGEDNAWLNTSLGAVHIALGEKEDAVEVLERASLAAQDITADQWRANYSFNDPAEVPTEIEQMLDVIAFNLNVARGEDIGVVPSIARVPFANTSPAGYVGGLAVSACGDSCSTISCVSAANICGEVNTGTQNTCTNVCSVGVPANPSGSCSVATSCGVDATGVNGCNGQCNITQYPFCQNVNGDDTVEWVTLGGEGGAADIVVDIFAQPILLAPGNSTVVRWLSQQTDSCTVTASSNGDSWTGTLGEELSSAIVQETTYTLSCLGYDGSTVTDSVQVRLVPEWQEF